MSITYTQPDMKVVKVGEVIMKTKDHPHMSLNPYQEKPKHLKETTAKQVKKDSKNEGEK